MTKQWNYKTAKSQRRYSKTAKHVFKTASTVRSVSRFCKFLKLFFVDWIKEEKAEINVLKILYLYQSMFCNFAVLYFRRFISSLFCIRIYRDRGTRLGIDVGLNKKIDNSLPYYVILYIFCKDVQLVSRGCDGHLFSVQNKSVVDINENAFVIWVITWARVNNVRLLYLNAVISPIFP